MADEDIHLARAIDRFGSWRALAGDLDNAPLTSLGREVVDSAIEVHIGFFTDEWLRRPIERRSGVATSIWDWPLGTPRAVIQALERAARIQLLDDVNRQRLAAVTQETAGARSFGHADIVLETAGLARRAGWTVEVEPATTTRRTPDLRLRRLGMRYLVEVTSLGFDRETIASERFGTTYNFRAIVFEDDHNVDLSTDLQVPYLDEPALELWFAVLAEAAPRVAPGKPVTIQLPEGTATLHARGERPEQATTFSSGVLMGDMWPRFATRLREKAEQTAGGEPSWIRIDESAGMFIFSSAAHLQAGERHQLLLGLCERELAEFPHVRGVIISHGAELAPADTPPVVMLDRHREPWAGSALVDLNRAGFR